MEAAAEDPVLAHFTAMARRVANGEDPHEVERDADEFLAQWVDASPWTGGADRVWWDLGEIFDLPRADPGDDPEQTFRDAATRMAARWLAVDQGDPREIQQYFDGWESPAHQETHSWEAIERFYQGLDFPKPVVDHAMLHLTHAVMACELRDELDAFADIWGLCVWPRGGDRRNERFIRLRDGLITCSGTDVEATQYPVHESHESHESLDEQAQVLRRLCDDAWGAGRRAGPQAGTR